MINKMKTMNLVKIAAVILLGITLNGTANAESHKYSRSVQPVFKQLTHSVKLTIEDNRNMQECSIQPVAEWMFEEDYLNMENESGVASWMLDTDYLDEQAQPLESWMFNEDRLSENEPCNMPQSWMFDVNYLSR
jgi:hypothetical protein